MLFACMNWYLLICVDICSYLTTFINIWWCLRKQSHWSICSLRIPYMIHLVSGWPEAHFWLSYLLMFVDICWSVVIFVCISWYLLMFVDICCYLTKIINIWRCLRKQSHWYICIASMINLVSGAPEAHFWLGQLMICGDIRLYFMMFAYICWYLLLLDNFY